MTSLRIEASRSYDVRIEKGLFDNVGELVRSVSVGSKVCIVSDDIVFALYGERAIRSLESAGFEVFKFVFEHGEGSKCIRVYTELLEYLLCHRLTRSDMLVALGGGVVGDLTGFAAATYQRGIRFVQVPTTLLAMVDSSVGGKTAVNLENGKNQVGAFYQPSLVVCDPDILSTLPEEEFLCGCAEVIKYAVFGDREFFEQLENIPAKEQLENIITRCIEMKRDVVAADEFDNGARMILNLGHTVGHTVEALSGFTVLHGQGVAIGMSVICRSAKSMGMLSDDDCKRIINLIAKYGLPTQTQYSLEDIYGCALSDKKVSDKYITIVVPDRIGSAKLVKLPKEELREWLAAGGIQQ